MYDRDAVWCVFISKTIHTHSRVRMGTYSHATHSNFPACTEWPVHDNHDTTELHGLAIHIRFPIEYVSLLDLLILWLMRI